MLGLGPTDNLPIPLSDGSWVSEKVNRIIELVREYDPRLDVAWIPRDKRAASDPAFAILEHTADGRQHVVFYVQDESGMDGSVLERLYQTDAQKQGNLLSVIDARNAAVKAIAKKKYEDEMAERHDIAASIIRSPKARYRHNGKVYE